MFIFLTLFIIVSDIEMLYLQKHYLYKLELVN